MNKDKKMEQIYELADTTTTTADNYFPDLLGKQWADRVIEFGEALRKFDQVCYIDKGLVSSNDKTLYIPYTTSHLSLDVSRAAGEGGIRDTTELTNLTSVEVTIAAACWEQGAITITKEVAKTVKTNLITQARYAIAQDLAQRVDANIATALQATTVDSVVYGGTGNTGVDGLATGDVITVDHVADAMNELENNNFIPAYLFMHPTQTKVFRKDPQFVNASEYGSGEVVMKGEIGNYLGVKVISTTNTPGYALSATDVNETPTTWGAAGHCAIMVGTGPANQPVACALAWKEMPSIGYEYDKKRNKHWIFYDQTYKAQIIQPEAVCLIKTTDA